MFGRQRIDTSLNQQIREKLSRHNENVRANSEILRKLIKATCFLARQELPFRGHSESSESINRGHYVELLEYTKEHDALLNSHPQSATVFKGTSQTVQNELTSACNDVLLDAITDETKNARFAANKLDETSDIASKSQLSTVIRYVCNGEVYGICIGFTDVSSNRTAAGLMVHAEKTVAANGLLKKLIGQAYDGANVMSGHLEGLQRLVLNKYPKTLFVYSSAHALNFSFATRFAETK